MSVMNDGFPSQTEIQASSHLDPEFLEFLRKQEIPDPPFTDVAQCRGLASFADTLILKSLPEIPSKLEEIIVEIPAGDDKNHTNTATIVRPKTSECRGPLIVLFHPSGFFVPSTAKLIPHARGLASLFNATVVSPRYRLAPEHPFPTGIDDSWAAVRWASENVENLNVDVEKGFIIGGISSGANFAVATARRAVEEGLSVRVTGVWAPLFIGFGLADQEGIAEGVPEELKSLCTSRVQNLDAIVISSTKARDLFAHLRPNFRSPLFNPLADLNSFDLSTLPPTYLQVAGADYFRDDSLILASALRSHGVDVRLDFYPGMTHSFWLYAAHLTQSQKCFRDIVVGFAWLLGVHVEALEKGWETVLVNMGCVVDLRAAAAEFKTRE